MDIDTTTVEVPGSAAAAGFGTDADGGTRFGASAGVNSALVLTEFSAGTLVFLAAKPLNCNCCNFNCNFLICCSCRNQLNIVLMGGKEYENSESGYLICYVGPQ